MKRTIAVEIGTARSFARTLRELRFARQITEVEEHRSTHKAGLTVQVKDDDEYAQLYVQIQRTRGVVGVAITCPSGYLVRQIKALGGRYRWCPSYKVADYLTTLEPGS